jgi:hypothetical protein
MSARLKTRDPMRRKSTIPPSSKWSTRLPSVPPRRAANGQEGMCFVAMPH